MIKTATMKKLNKIYIACLGTLVLLNACNKQLNLQPFQSVSQNQALTTAADVQVTLVGAYNRASQSDLYGGGAFLYPDLLATQTEITWQGTFQGLTQMTDQQITIDNGFVNGTWADGYQVINQVNNVLANLSKVDTANAGRTEGEAKFLRGLTYFDLARLFGRAWNDGDPATNLAVPIILTPTVSITPASFVSRATVSQVYAQAIADLQDAEAKLPASNSFYANKYAASAILARLYLQQGNYTSAANESTKVLSANVFSLNAIYSAEFPYPGPQHVDNTPEDIFAIQVTNQQGVNYLNTFYASSDNAGRGDIIIQDSFLSLFTSDDTRLALYNEDSAGILRCDKFDNVYGNVHVIRLAELYLIRAESNLRISATSAIGDSPVNDINVIRARAGISSLSTVNIAQVLTERVKELAFEGGFFLHDGKRTEAMIGALQWNSPKLVFPIPQVEVTTNPNLKQNPGY